MRERFVPIKPGQLIREVSFKLLSLSVSNNGICAISLPEIYIKLPYQQIGKRGKIVTKQKHTPIAAVAAMRLKNEIGIEEGFTHGKMVRNFFNA